MNTNHARKWSYSSTVTKPKTDSKVVVKKVRKQGWITKGEKILYAFIGICLIVSAYYIVSFASANDTLNRDIQSLEKEIQEQQIINDTLSYEKKELSHPDRITRIAKEHGLKIQDAEVKQAQAYNN